MKLKVALVFGLDFESLVALFIAGYHQGDQWTFLTFCDQAELVRL